MTKGTTHFGALLAKLRNERKFTLRQLETASSVPNATIYMIEKNGKGCGQAIAVKLADGLGLSKEARGNFLEAANASARRNKEKFSPALVDAILDALKHSGANSIDYRQVKKVMREVRVGNRVADIVVELKNGERRAIEITSETIP